MDGYKLSQEIIEKLDLSSGEYLVDNDTDQCHITLARDHFLQVKKLPFYSDWNAWVTITEDDLLQLQYER